MASKRAEALQMEESINRLVANVGKFGKTVEMPRTLTKPADVAALIDGVSDALESITPVKPAKKTTAKKATK